MTTNKESYNDSVYGDPEMVVKLAALTRGKILEMRKEIPKSLILAALDNYEEGSKISLEEVSKSIQNITKCTISNSEIISNFNELEIDNVIEHLGHLKYRLKIKPNLSDFETLTQSVWKEFEIYVISRYSEYDPGIHTNTKKVFDSLLLKILVRFATSKPLENQVDRISLDNFDSIVNQEVKENYFPDGFAKAYPTITMDYFSSESPELLDFIFGSYCGVVNIDLVLKEQDLPSIDFGNEIGFLLLDSNFIIPLLCNTDSKNPLSIALINLCNKYDIPLYYTPKTKSEIWNSISNTKKAMMTWSGNSKGHQIESQFITDYSRNKGSWTDYYLVLSQWENKLEHNWNIRELSSEFVAEVEDECYDFMLKTLPMVDKFRFSYRTEKEVDYNIRLRSDKSYEHDAYCIGLLSHLKNNPMHKSSKKLLGPWFLTYDDLISFINQTQLRKDDDIGYSIHPRILLNYLLAYSKLEFDTEDKEYVAMALLRYTARPNASSITVEEYSRIFAEQIDVGSENATVLKSILLVSPLIDELENALKSGNRDEADIIAVEIFSKDDIKDLIREATYSSKKKEEQEQIIERLKSVIKNQNTVIDTIKDTKSTINHYGDYARVNMNSTDLSVNTITVNSENVFNGLRDAIETKIENSEEKKELLQQIEEMESSQGTEHFKTKYTNFVASAANHISIIAPFIPMLTTLLI
jgi:hypothetical protein